MVGSAASPQLHCRQPRPTYKTASVLLLDAAVPSKCSQAFEAEMGSVINILSWEHWRKHFKPSTGLFCHQNRPAVANFKVVTTIWVERWVLVILRPLSDDHADP